MSVPKLNLYAAAPAAFGEHLARELADFKASKVRVRGAGVAFEGSLETAYRACLWSRVASRVLLQIARFAAPDADALYAAARKLPWHEHMQPSLTFAVSATMSRARISHSHYAALRVKDAIADHFRERDGVRPSVDTRTPDIRIDLHLRGGEGSLALDLSGDAMHRRGYRLEAGEAPLRETLAAGMLYVADWPARAGNGETLLDPMCGSGTVVIEAALMAADIAPGLIRERFALQSWAGHDAACWDALLVEAKRRRERGLARIGEIVGLDADPRSIDMAQRNAARAGVEQALTLRCQSLERSTEIDGSRAVVVCNPPFGRRLSSPTPAGHWAEMIRAAYPGCDLIVLEPALDVGDTARHRHDAQRSASSRDEVAVMNGALPCVIRRIEARQAEPAPRPVDTTALANRLRKRFNHLARWARREGVSCWRVYDADLPEFAFAADIYHGERSWLHVAEYAPPAEVPPALAMRRLHAAIDVLAEVTAIEPDNVVLKRRQRQRGREQYAAQDRRETLLQIEEHGARVLVNLHDYLDTGLFLDHRPTRRWIRGHAQGIRFLNLFAYTGVASVHAALGGARETLSLDLSPRYCRWAARNLAENGMRAPQHRCQQVDCLDWLDNAPRDDRFDLVFMDPPTFSNSKRMARTLDVQRDHVAMIHAAMAHLEPGGLLIFSCNRRGFRLDAQALEDLAIEDMTVRSLDPDFQRQPPPHRCYHIRARPEAA